MTVTTIKLDDAAELTKQSWLELMTISALRLQGPIVRFSDAGNAGIALGLPEEAVRDLYGFRPIPAGGNLVTNDLVNDLREELGI